jgi:hypothetical protein
VGPGAGQDGCEKIPPAPRMDPRTVQSVASSHTDYVNTAHVNLKMYCKFNTLIILGTTIR